MSLLTGVRFEFVFSIFLIIYMFFYFKSIDKVSNKYDVKKALIVCGIIVPILLIFMSIYNSIRNKVSITKIDPFYEVQAFFVSQGRSTNLLTYAQMYEKELSGPNKSYVFGLFYDSINSKICAFSTLICNTNYTKNDINYGYAISNIILGEEKVIEGHGLGSQYLAELFLEGGVLFIIVYSLFFGGIINFFYRASQYSTLCLIFMINLLKPIMHLSRSVSFELFAPFTSITIWILILIYFCGMRIYERRT